MLEAEPSRRFFFFPSAFSVTKARQKALVWSPAVEKAEIC